MATEEHGLDIATLANLAESHASDAESQACDNATSADAGAVVSALLAIHYDLRLISERQVAVIAALTYMVPA